MPEVMVRCHNCGKWFLSNTPRPRKYCSKECRLEVRHKRAKKYVCEYCGKEFGHSKNGHTVMSAHRFCSRECAFAARRVLGEARRYAGRSCPIYITTCESCGRVIVSRVKHGRFCSPHCRHVALYRPKPARSKVCAECGNTFLHSGRGCRQYCSGRCARRAFRRTRKQKMRSRVQRHFELVRLGEIWDRDNGRCQLCGQIVLRNAHGETPNPFGHALDHRQPVTAYGENTKDNIQLTHFICNTLKSDKLGPVSRLEYKCHLDERLCAIIRGEDERWIYRPAASAPAVQ